MLKENDLKIIDTTAPFFAVQNIKKINWSKAPLDHLEKKNKPHKKKYKKIFKDFYKYIKKIKEIGFNAVSIDDLSHILSLPCYPEKTKKKIFLYKKIFKKLFSIAQLFDLKIFITTDIMFFHESLIKEVGHNLKKITELLKIEIDKLFLELPEITGIIIRIGESDGIDVKSEFKSKIIIKKPEQANFFIKKLLPVFEKRNKICIFRTWTTGAHKIGDLMWNPKTFRKVFSKIKSSNFIISMKYGETDFFRNVEVNNLFFLTKYKKIVELQTRREYEGFGEFPSFIGWEYEKIRDKLKDAPEIAGIYVWCQTGGWSRFRNFTFLKNASYWNELNTIVTIKLFTESKTTDEIVNDIFKSEKKSNKMLRFLKLSDKLIYNVLYDPAFSDSKLYFNRVRIPPLIHIFWDHVTITNLTRAFYQIFSKKKKSSIKKAKNSLKKIKRMKKIAKDLSLPYDYKFQFFTFYLLTLCRSIIYSNKTKKLIKKFEKLKRIYKKKYPDGYRFHINCTGEIAPFLIRQFIKIAIRKRKKYRFIDILLFNPIMSLTYSLIYRIMIRNFPKFLNKQAMPVNTFFK